MILIAAGYSNLDVAERVGVSESTITRWKRLKGFQVTVESYRTKAAAEQFEKLLESGSTDEIVEKIGIIEKTAS